jgi:phosphoribosylamine--glycine ligase
VLTNGGRVLTVVAMGETIAKAREKVYDNISRIQFEGAHYRKDIALFK